MVRRFEIARAIGSGNAGLFNNEDNTPGPADGLPDAHVAVLLRRDRTRPRRDARDALAQTTSQQEWNTMLLASPDWMQR